MVKPVEAVLCLVNRCLLLCNLFETPGSFMQQNNTLFK
jgi:hypothetical protein